MRIARRKLLSMRGAKSRGRIVCVTVTVINTLLTHLRVSRRASDVVNPNTFRCYKLGTDAFLNCTLAGGRRVQDAPVEEAPVEEGAALELLEEKMSQDDIDRYSDMAEDMAGDYFEPGPSCSNVQLGVMLDCVSSDIDDARCVTALKSTLAAAADSAVEIRMSYLVALAIAIRVVM